MQLIQLLGTHVFLVVVRQGEFPLRQHKLPLKKLGVVFTFLPQHPLVETCCPKSKENILSHCNATFCKTRFHLPALVFAKNRFFLRSLRVYEELLYEDCQPWKHHLQCMKQVDTLFLP